MSKICGDKIYLWLSNPPLTEFYDGREIKPMQWNSFTQRDEHRGVFSDRHIWRVFIRACPVTIMEAAPESQWQRRHCQVYLDANNFKW